MARCIKTELGEQQRQRRRRTVGDDEEGQRGKVVDQHVAPVWQAVPQYRLQQYVQVPGQLCGTGTHSIHGW